MSRCACCRSAPGPSAPTSRIRWPKAEVAVTIRSQPERSSPGRVAMVGGGVEHLGAVALGADTVAGGTQCLAVGFVAVAADHAGLVHLALQERAVDVDLVQNLSIRVVQRRLQHGQSVGVEQLGSVVVVPQGATARVAARAVVHLGSRVQRLGSARDGFTLGEKPVAPLREVGGKPTAVQAR